jgi:hypothetical protein
MTRDEAKLILSAYRPGGQDAGDPQFAAALTLAKTDLELAAWFAAEQTFDANVSNHLQQLRVPSRLKAEILAANRPETPSFAAWWQHLFSRQSPVSWALAAIIILVFTIAIFWKKPAGSTSFAEYSAQMVHAAVHDANHVDAPAADLKQAMAWLTAHQGDKHWVLPLALNDGPGLMGCRVLDWRGRKVSMLCYNINDSAHVDVFVTAANVFPDAPPVDQPQFARNAETATAGWTHEGKVYLTVSHGDETILKKILSPQTALESRPDYLAVCTP